MRHSSFTRFRVKSAAAAAGLALILTSAAGLAQPPSIEAKAGKPTLLLGAYDLSALGYQVEEYFLSGMATAYQLAGPANPDGRWTPTPAGTAPFTTRIVVIRPADPAKFNGTVLTEWFNVTAGQDTPADWMVAHREMLRKGYAYVGVSAQQVGVEGGDAVMSQGVSLKKANPQRYGGLSHPGDAFAFDIYSQAGATIKTARPGGVLGPLSARRVLAIGESQSAAFLTSYVNAIDPIARVYDGFFIHSRFGSAAALDGRRMDSQTAMPRHVHFRPDLRVPLLTLITETDLLGARLSGYHASRTADNRRLRVWELAGSSHADNYLFKGAFIDSGLKSSADLARIYLPLVDAPGGKLAKPSNPGMPHHYVTEAAIAGLDAWVRTGKAPASTRPLELATGGQDGISPSLALDANGLARGGVRTPWVDVPTARLSGTGNAGSFLALLVGSGEPFDKAMLARLYPGGKAEYLRRFRVRLDAAIRVGHILREDRQEILDIAAINFDG